MPNIISNTIQLHVAGYDSETSKYKFLVLKRSEKAKLYPSVWQVITGKIKENETALDTAKRELEEETKLKPAKMWAVPYITSFFETAKDSIHLAPVFGVVVENMNEIQLSDEHECFEWLDYQECIDRLLLPTHKEGTKHFNDYCLKNHTKELKIDY